MEIMYERVAGLDVHKATIVACVRLGTGRKVTRECRTFDTTTDGLLALLAWLVECRCSHVAMEATGIYWMPAWKILSDGDFSLIVAKAAANHNGSLHSALLGFLDTETACRYRDQSLDAELDLSRVSYIATANDASKLPAPLRDRFRIIKVPAPTLAHLPQLPSQFLLLSPFGYSKTSLGAGGINKKCVFLESRPKMAAH